MTLQTDLQNLLRTALRTPGTIHIVRAAPGQGKTRSTVLALADLLAGGGVQRVLWAVRETTGEDSLGRQAANDLKNAGLVASVVYGRGETLLAHLHRGAGWRVAAETTYRQQFAWQTGPEVKVISHAHLPLIYGKDARSAQGQSLADLRKAELLIVDEDPSDVFLLDQNIINQGRNRNARAYLRLNSVFFKAREDGISAALRTLLARAAAGDFDAEARSWGFPGNRTYSLTGAGFWEALAGELPPAPSWGDFAQTLKTTAKFGYGTGIAPWVVSRMHSAFRTHTAGGGSSAQFGLTWPERHQERAELDVQLRFNVSQYRPIKCSVVVLDAYAQPTVYAAAFRPSPTCVHEVGPGTVLEVTMVPGAGRHRTDVARGLGSEHVLALMEQVVEYARNHGNTLLLCYKNTKSSYQVALDRARELAPLPPGVQLELQHWRAGRGSNDWEGWNVIALEEFAFPREYAEHALSALVPQDGDASRLERQTIQHLHSASETLQMLYRGRQTLAVQRGWLRAPDVLTLYPLNLYELSSMATTRASTVLFSSPARRTTRPRFAQAVGVYTTELHALLGGVPMMTFRAVGLEDRKAQVSEVTLDHIRAKLRLLIRASSTPLPNLTSWAETGKLVGYEDTRRTKRGSRKELVEAAQSVMPSLMEHRNLRPARSPAGIRRIPGTVLATSHSAAQEAVDTLFDEL